jgi:CBS domain-containing protein
MNIKRLILLLICWIIYQYQFQEDADLTDAAQIMSNNRISGLPVVNSLDNLVGIVTKTDITKALIAS